MEGNKAIVSCSNRSLIYNPSPILSIDPNFECHRHIREVPFTTNAAMAPKAAKKASAKKSLVLQELSIAPDGFSIGRLPKHPPEMCMKTTYIYLKRNTFNYPVFESDTDVHHPIWRKGLDFWCRKLVPGRSLCFQSLVSNGWRDLTNKSPK